MKDRVHQPYRMALVSDDVYRQQTFRSAFKTACSFFNTSDHQIPGLQQIVSDLTPKTHPGLLGICLSGAGPTILALATSNFDVRLAWTSLFKDVMA